MYKNGPPSSLMRASCTDYYELITDNFITSGISTYCVIIVQPHILPDNPDRPDTPPIAPRQKLSPLEVSLT